MALVSRDPYISPRKEKAAEPEPAAVIEIIVVIIIE